MQLYNPVFPISTTYQEQLTTYTKKKNPISSLDLNWSKRFPFNIIFFSIYIRSLVLVWKKINLRNTLQLIS